MKIKDFFKECHEKKVFKNLSIYLVSSWVLLQVVALIYEPIGLPKSTMTYVLLILLIGFPFYVYWLWKFRLKPLEEPIQETHQNSDTSKRASSKSGIDLDNHDPSLLQIPFNSEFHKTYITALITISVLTLFTTFFVVKTNFADKNNTELLSTLSLPADADKIAVLKFENNTLDANLDVVGKMAVDWIIHGITQNKEGQVISPKIVEEYEASLKTSNLPKSKNKILETYLKPSKIISGTYYKINDELLLQCSIFDGTMTNTLISFEPESCNSNNPLDCIEALKQRILGYLATESNSENSFEEIPPNYQAYQYLLEAHTKYANTNSEYLKLLNEAITVDSTFFEPKLDRLEYYYNRDEFVIADSLYRKLSQSTTTNKRQMNLLYWYDALLRGNNRNAYTYFLNEYKMEPFDLENNSTAMVLALQYVNKPHDIDSIYKTLSMDDMDLEKCQICEYRHYLKALATIELGNPQKVVELLGSFRNTKGYNWIKETLLRAYIQIGDTSAVQEVMQNIAITSSSERWARFALFCGKEYLFMGDKESANNYLDQLITSLELNYKKASQTERDLLPFAFYYRANYPKAQELFQQAFETNKDPALLSLLAISSFKNGDQNQASNIIQELNSMRTSFQFGLVDYSMAQYYATIEAEEKSMEYLLKAVAAGHRYTPSKFQHDIHFKPYLDTEAFKNVMTFWH